MPPAGDLRQRARELFAGLRVRQDSLGALAQQAEAIRFLQVVPDNQNSCRGQAIEDIAEQRSGGLARGMGVDYIYALP